MNIYRIFKVAAYAGLLGFYSSNVVAGDLGVEGTVTATTFVGNGSGLTGVLKNEVDPQVGSVTASKWCVGDGSAVQCNRNAPVTTEVDPVVNTLSADKWCKADAAATVINCDQDAPKEPVTFQLWVPKTGQTQCWNEYAEVRVCDNTGEDGEYQMGGRIIAPIDRDDWHPSFRANPRFADNADGTVTDNLTGLIWLTNANCIADNTGFDNDGVVDDGRVTWQHGLDFIRGINTGLYDCGDTSNSGSLQTDWRLPNHNELLSLTDPSRRDPALSPGHPFLDVHWSYYWSSTTYAPHPYHAYDVYIYGGSPSDASKFLYYACVWPVRGGQKAY